METDETIEQHAEPMPEHVAAPSPAAVAEKRTVEHWARAKGMLPEFAEGKKPPNARPKAKPPLVHNPKFAHFHAAKHGRRWPIGMELTEAEFNAAIAETQAHVYR